MVCKDYSSFAVYFGDFLYQKRWKKDLNVYDWIITFDGSVNKKALHYMKKEMRRENSGSYLIKQEKVFIHKNDRMKAIFRV